MSDIFLSYSREDQASARRFAESLQRAGFSVWWDQTLRSGEAYDEVTEQALKSAKAVVVLWSKASVASRWVRAEATIADRAGTLVPVMIEPCDRPVMFELRQSADLTGWRGDTDDKRWRALLDDLKVVTGDRSAALPSASVPAAVRPSKRSGLAIAVAALALILLGTGVWLLRRGHPVDGAAAGASVASVPATDKTLAVLPFANLSSDPEQEFFADGLTEELLNSLARLDGLQVTEPHFGVLLQGPRTRSLKVIGEKLGVEHLLEGQRAQGRRPAAHHRAVDQGRAMASISGRRPMTDRRRRSSPCRKKSRARWPRRCRSRSESGRARCAPRHDP